MDIADKVEQELQGHQPLSRQGSGITQLFGELLDLVDDAVVLQPVAGRRHRRQSGFAKARLRQIGVVSIQLYVMPFRRGKATLRAFFAQSVRPGGLAGDVGLGPGIGLVGGEQLAELSLRRGVSWDCSSRSATRATIMWPSASPRPALRGRQAQARPAPGKGWQNESETQYIAISTAAERDAGRNPMLPLR